MEIAIGVATDWFGAVVLIWIMTDTRISMFATDLP
jgi:hypothetical protein